jgi:hypothetical protein
VASTYYCINKGLSANFSLALIATAVVFPVVFSISGAYKRRETALSKYASLKGHAFSFYFVVRDWVDKDESITEECKVMLEDFFVTTKFLFSSPYEEFRSNEKKVYLEFSKLSEFTNKKLRGKGLAGGELSRANQYLSKMFISFEELKHIYQYRTPKTLRAFSDFFITILPPLYGPYFAHLAEDFPSSLIFVMPILFSVILVSLDNIQNHLENPFDQIGEDDIQINVEPFVQRLT